MGLSLSPDSLLSQLGDNFNRRFSYCMVPFSLITEPVNLRFGDDIPIDAGRVQTTPFLVAPNLNYYVLNLIDISVNSVPIHFPAGTFQGGFIIDSGAPFTLMDEKTTHVNAYQVLTGALQIYYNLHGLQERKLDGSDSICYDETPGFDQHPTITYHFQGADYTVDSRFIYTRFTEPQPTYFCINIFKGNGVSILGANHQQNMRIIYDNNINAIQFFPEECAHDIA
ncbi:hypothetical protein Dsin_022650 [Dipteronia sinensis]|uniref:Peptidase A1 domain-containing protein n=1 Tax=Dipteronia sinensis TaxID=43782 RepID=A0AAE0A2C1_9ROSI|nr:hypothetical protein Dsin_022650 [Dipteronia sinensis]